MVCRRTFLGALAARAFAQTPAADGSRVRIPGGSFEMGLDGAEIERRYRQLSARMRDVPRTATPRHPVTLAPFYLDRHQVTKCVHPHSGQTSVA